MKFIWIDDNPERATSSQNLANAIKVDCRFINAENNDAGVLIKNLLSDEEPDLIIIDHNLINAVDPNNEKDFLIRKGSSAASIIRQQWKSCPIICVSGVDADAVDSQEKSIYEEIYAIHKISNFYSEIFTIAKSFKEIKNHIPKDTYELLEILKCPETEAERLKAIMPKSLKENFHDGGIIVEISNWVRKILLLRPGFLYDKLWSATLLGLNSKGFEKVESLFKGAQYNGIFANDENPRWWKTDLIKLLAECVDSPGLPSHKSRLLPGVEETDYSICYVTDEPFPETVAFVDQTKDSSQEAMKLKVTVLHEGYEKLLYFDEIRLMMPME